VRAAGVVAAALLLVACGSSGASPVLFTRPATAYLLTLDELRTPGFTVSEPPHAWTSANDAGLSRLLGRDALHNGATVTYFRDVPEIATSNGPIMVISFVFVCSSTQQAAAVYSVWEHEADALPAVIPESAGALGDVAHADEEHITNAPVQLIQLVITWRTGNLVSELTVRGRDGGVSLADALILAHAQAAGQT
jgi:hypothetical protein